MKYMISITHNDLVLLDVYLEAKERGIFAMEDFSRLATYGIPILKILTDSYEFMTIEDIRNGSVTFEIFSGALLNWLMKKE